MAPSGLEISIVLFILILRNGTLWNRNTLYCTVQVMPKSSKKTPARKAAGWLAQQSPQTGGSDLVLGSFLGRPMAYIRWSVICNMIAQYLSLVSRKIYMLYIAASCEYVTCQLHFIFFKFVLVSCRNGKSSSVQRQPLFFSLLGFLKPQNHCLELKLSKTKYC